MFFNNITSSDVRPGDHIYRYRWFTKQQGIAIRFPKLSSVFVVTSYKNTLSLITLNEFKGRGSLKRAIYNQDNSYTSKTKFFQKSITINRRPSEEIVQNALLLLDWIKTSPDRVHALFANDFSEFARRCCTTVHEQWSNLFRPSEEQASPKKHFFDKELSSGNSSTFNFALMCGMPFRQASQIGTDEFWVDKHEENDSLQTTEDYNARMTSSSDETMIFSPALIELSAIDELLSHSFV